MLPLSRRSPSVSAFYVRHLVTSFEAVGDQAFSCLGIQAGNSRMYPQIRSRSSRSKDAFPLGPWLIWRRSPRPWLSAALPCKPSLFEPGRRIPSSISEQRATRELHSLGRATEHSKGAILRGPTTYSLWFYKGEPY